MHFCPIIILTKMLFPPSPPDRCQEDGGGHQKPNHPLEGQGPGGSQRSCAAFLPGN